MDEVNMQKQEIQKIGSLKDLKSLSDKMKEYLSGKTVISLCSGTGCRASYAIEVFAEMEKALKKKAAEDPEKTKNVVLKRTGCHGFCEKGPIIVIYPEEICYLQVSVEDIEEIIQKTIDGELVERLLYKDKDGIKIRESDIPFYKYQRRIILKNNSKIDPNNINDYVGLDGYQALAKVLEEMGPEQVIEEIKASKLRGRGGGGFPTGLKWETARNEKKEPKYMILNADEGDPGAFMDRSILEGNPHSVIEGITIAAFAVGSGKCFVYVRAEYPLAVETLENAIVQARKAGLLGNNILNSGFDFDIEIYQGAGAFVCGEETALIKSVEGKRGMPTPKPPFPASEGLYGMPTVINNVETYANVGPIILNGANWFNTLGTKTSKGTKIFALVGKVNNTGLVEVPMGMSLRDIVYKIGGGIQEGKKIKAVQLGGPSGGCIPEQFLDIPVDYEKVKEAGSMMGSGGMIVLDEEECMVSIARYFMDFIQDESCGQCVPCRIGTGRMLEILERITKGKGQEDDIEKLLRLSEVVKETSLCGLGKTAPNPVLSTIKHFREEFEEHIAAKKSCERLHSKAKVKKT
jgi:NADH:ubiquinone oxidoreductase subunit F (NADH-binding)/(2Fe-2S) ferredoxin